MLDNLSIDEISKKLAGSKVAIAGLGGLGSNVAMALTRAGIGSLFLVDFDVVAPSNLNRQFYFSEQVGQFKTLALKNNLKKINQNIELITENIILDENNIGNLFDKYDYIAECLDLAETKAMFVQSILKHEQNKKFLKRLFCVSGIAGYMDYIPKEILLYNEKLLLIGDQQSEANEVNWLCAARVNMIAMHQALCIIQELLKA